MRLLHVVVLAEIVQNVIESVQDNDPVKEIPSRPDPFRNSLDMKRDVGFGGFLQSFDEVPNRKRLYQQGGGGNEGYGSKYDDEYPTPAPSSVLVNSLRKSRTPCSCGPLWFPRRPPE